MNEKLQPAVTALKERFGGTDSEFRGDVTVTLAPGRVVPAARALLTEFGFDMLINETAVDYWPQQDPRFHVVYHLYSMKNNVVLCLRVPLSGNAPHIATMENVFPGANWPEREMYDMFGIFFDGHSDLRRIVMPHDWEGHPLRKDYPLGYEEVQHSFNFNEVSARKPSAKE
jgi:NADH-quinone oxidoreductase subunit C